MNNMFPEEQNRNLFYENRIKC